MGNLGFNYRIAKLPAALQDYIVVHELCHLIRPDHSPAFWRLVGDRRPTWRDEAGWLRAEFRVAGDIPLLERLLAIERAHGRTRDFPNAPRRLDLDIALYGNCVIQEPDLIVPHPRLCERAFVLVPLAEIAPDAIVPGRGRVADLLRDVDASALVKLS